MPGSEMHATPYEIAHHAIDLAMECGVAPSWQIYEVLSRHLEGTNKALSDDVTVARGLPLEKRADALEEIHTKYRGVDVMREEVERVCRQMREELGETTRILGDSIDGSLRLAGDLKKSLRDIAGVVTREDLQSIARSMAMSGRAHLASAQTNSNQLERTRDQLATMEVELERLQQEALTDPLTGLPNRRAIDQHLALMVGQSAPFSVAVIDLDRFKEVNDTWGHMTGDNILRGLAGVMKRNVRGRDFAGRYGGEEFLLILPDTPVEGAKTVCEAVRKEFASINWVSTATSDQIGNLTLSAGVAMWRKDEDEFALIDRADQELYAAKTAGRNRTSAAAA